MCDRIAKFIDAFKSYSYQLPKLSSVQTAQCLPNVSPHVREPGIRNPTFLCLWNPESGALESGIQSLESGIQPVESGIQPHP